METLSQLKITACNIRGLSKANLKLQFKKVKNVTGNADVICLIDTHFTKQIFPSSSARGSNSLVNLTLNSLKVLTDDLEAQFYLLGNLQA